MQEGRDLIDAELKVADTVGHLMEFWGFKRPMGRVWTMLYLSPEPLGAAEISERLAMSSGAVSMTVSALLQWGAIKRAWRPGERREFFEAETSIWKMVTRVIRERELALVRSAAEAFSGASAALARAGRKMGKAERRRVDFVRGRVEFLLSLARIGETLLGAIVAGQAAVDTKPFREAVREIAEAEVDAPEPW